MFSIQTNVMAMTANRFANGHQSAVSKALERLSSGKKINSAADDASGLARVQAMRARLSGLEATQEAMIDSLSKAELGDSIMAGIQDMMQRMNELATKSASGTYSDSDRQSMEAEYQSLLEEIERSSHSTYNETELFAPKNATINDALGKSGGGDGHIITGSNINAYLDGLDNFLAEVSNASKNNDVEKLKELGVSTDKNLSDSEKLRQAVIEFTNKNGDKLLNSGSSQGSYNITVGGDGSVKIAGSAVKPGKFGLGGTSIATAESAGKAMEALKDSINKVSKSRAEYGSTMKRIEHSLNNLSQMQIDIAESISRIEDADMAKEMMNYTKSQILLQAAQAMIAQANNGTKDTAAFVMSMLGE